MKMEYGLDMRESGKCGGGSGECMSVWGCEKVVKYARWIGECGAEVQNVGGWIVVLSFF